MKESKIFGIEENDFDAAMKVVHGLYGLERTGWVQRGVKNPETVGQHVDALIQMAKKVCEIKKDLDQKKLIRMLQIHDWPEHQVGDIVAVSHDEEERKKLLADKESKEVSAIEDICSKLGPEGAVILEIWKEFEAKKTPEAQIAYQLDKMQAMYKAWEYEKAGNGRVSAKGFIVYAKDKITDSILVQWLRDLEDEVNKQ